MEMTSEQRRAITQAEKISASILAQVALGKSVKDAVDAVLGKGTYEKIASDVWDAAR